jgi:hypothetical protein
MMKIVSFIEAHQGPVIERILRHCGLWKPPAARGPPRRAGKAVGRLRQYADSNGVEMDEDYWEHVRREREAEQLNLPWD